MRLTKMKFVTKETVQVIVKCGMSAMVYAVTPLHVENRDEVLNKSGILRNVFNEFMKITEKEPVKFFVSTEIGDEVISFECGKYGTVTLYYHIDTPINWDDDESSSLSYTLSNCDDIVVTEYEDESDSIADLCLEYDDELFMDILPLIKLGCPFELIDTVSDVSAEFGVNIAPCISKPTITSEQVWDFVEILREVNDAHVSNLEKVIKMDLLEVLDLGLEKVLASMTE